MSLHENKDDAYYFVALNNLAVLYQDLGYYDQAEPLMLEVKDLIVAKYGADTDIYAHILNNLGTLAAKLSQYDDAKNYMEASLELKKKLLGETSLEYAFGLQNASFVYKSIGDLKKAELLASNCLAIQENRLGKQHADCALTLNNLGMLYLDMEQYDLAEDYLRRSLEIRKRTLKGANAPIATALNNLGKLYELQGNYSDALIYYKQSKQMFIEVRGDKHPEVVAGWNNIAKVHVELSNIDSALWCNQNAFYAAGNDLDSTFLSLSLANLIKSIPNIDYTNYQSFYVSIVTLHDILTSMYNSSNDIHDAENLHALNVVITETYQMFSHEFNSKKDKLTKFQHNIQFAEWGIDIAHELYLKKKDETYLQDAFFAAEQNKSMLLSDILQNQTALSFGGVPDSLIAKETILNNERKSLESKLYSADSEERKTIATQILEKEKEIEQLNEGIAIKYPKYYELKYVNNAASIEQIQSLLNEESLLIEYFISDSTIYIFTINKQDINIHKCNLPTEDLEVKIKNLRIALSDYHFIGKEEEKAYQQYTQNAYELYQVLLAPVLEKQEGNIADLYIIADGALGHLPFETFLTSMPEDGSEYKDLPYLLLDYNISYHYSAQLFYHQQTKVLTNKNTHLLVCGASYENKDTLSTHRSSKQKLQRSFLTSLPAIESEVNHLQELFNGTFLYGSDANEKRFKQDAPNSSIIHLAMHGLLNPNNPLLSSLAFTEDGDSLEDNFLQAYEISNMNLNAELVVLSACETGFGKFEKGEGIMSLARAFMYAGVKSLVMSMWEVNDASTAQIMQYFYQNLANNQSKSAALREAKVRYISEAKGNLSHPAYWSPFIQLGNDNAIKINAKYNSIWWWILGGIGTLCLLIGVAKMRKK